MIKRILLAIVLVLLIVGALAGTKFLQIRKMIAQGEAFVMPPAVVSAVNATSQTWETSLSAVGSVTPVQGVTLTAETTGRISRIAFESGAKVAAGDVLVQLDISEETANLRSAQAAEELARINVERLKKLVPQQASPKADYDTAQAQLRQAQAQIESLKAIIAKKTLRAPFAGTLGIRKVNLGQNVDTAAPVVALQRLDKVYVEFQLPQQAVAQVQTGFPVRITSDALSGRELTGKLTVIEPLADSATRTVRMQAVLDNPDEKLRPGMFVQAAVILAEQKSVTLVPATAVLYAAYSDSVYVIESKAGADGKQELVLRQQFVKLGERRGDFVAIQSGLAPGVTVVSSGVFKYRNGQNVVIDNTLAPEFKLSPNPENS